MRTMDRRDQLLRLLRRRADWTAAGLAAELGVSRRTVLRDLGGLREAGFDLATFSGPGGGVRLNPTSIMITSQLRASEVVALIVSAEIARAAKTVPFAAGAEQALAKIEQALPASRARELRTLRERILVGDPSRDARPAAIDPALVEAFENAFTTTRLLAFTYRDQQGRRTRRQVEPHGLLVRPPLWYVLAWDTGKNAPRLFRADRISTPRVIDHTFVPRPADLVTGVCPDARPTTTARAGAHAELPAHHVRVHKPRSQPPDRGDR
jgi:predicted DNA-binding transcriptional regulator YafY